MKFVALLRGINLLGHKRLPMPALQAMFEAAGCTGVRTYIQSGNVVFSVRQNALRTVARHVEAEITRQFGFSCVFTTRSQEQMQAVVAGNPFVAKAKDNKALHVYFLADAPTPEQVKLLDPDHSPGDEFRVAGREIYLYLPNGMGQTKLSNQYFDSRLKTMSTARNWNTVQKLVRMMAE